MGPQQRVVQPITELLLSPTLHPMAIAHVPLPFTRKPLKSKSFSTFLQSNIIHTEPFTTLLLLLQSHTPFTALLLRFVLHPSHSDPSVEEDLKKHSTSSTVNSGDDGINEFRSSRKLLVGLFSLEDGGSTDRSSVGWISVRRREEESRQSVWVPIFLAFQYENITRFWVPNGLGDIFRHYWVIENE